MDYNLRSLQILEAVYRHKSINGAANELDITPSAVSHQIRNLSEEIGEKLIEKSGRGIILTETGERLAESLNLAFIQIARSVSQTVGKESNVVRLALCSSFGPGWLIERMADFHARQPGFRLQIRMYAQNPQLTDMIADAFVTAYPLEAGFASIPLFDEVLIAVQRPGLAADAPLITTDTDPSEVGADWRDFLSHTRHSLPQMDSQDFLQCTHYLIALEMARHGLGRALVPDFLAKTLIAAGDLSRIYPEQVPSGRRYFFSYKAARKSEPGLQALGAWFKQQVSGQAGQR